MKTSFLVCVVIAALMALADSKCCRNTDPETSTKKLEPTKKPESRCCAISEQGPSEKPTSGGCRTSKPSSTTEKPGSGEEGTSKKPGSGEEGTSKKPGSKSTSKYGGGKVSGSGPKSRGNDNGSEAGGAAAGEDARLASQTQKNGRETSGSSAGSVGKGAVVINSQSG